MINKKGLPIQKICITAGLCLLVVAIALFGWWSISISRSEKQAQSYVDRLQALVARPQDAVPAPRGNNDMPALSVSGTDFVGIIELPDYNSVLPVGGDWGKVSKHPCRFDGSVYDGTLQIGATTQKGQYNFYRELSVGDKVVYTDMEGNRYTYMITSVRNEKHVDKEALERDDAQLTLFIKNIYSFDYLVVYCNLPN